MIVLLKMKIKKVEKNSEHKFASDEKKEKSFFFFFVFVVVVVVAVVVVVVVVVDRNSAEKNGVEISSKSQLRETTEVGFVSPEEVSESRNRKTGGALARDQRLVVFLSKRTR